MEKEIGIFLCNCGGGIKNIDFDAVREKLVQISDVAFVAVSSALCLEEGKGTIVSTIKDKGVEKVVIAACSPEFTEHTFGEVLEKAGLNRHLLAMANVREQCAWAHQGDVTKKAIQLIKMAVNRARLLQPVQKKELPINKDVLVIGGGFSGLNIALQLSRLGLRATVLEKEAVLGARLGEAESFSSCDMGPMISEVESDDNIEVLTSAQLVRIEGNVGNFSVRIQKAGEEIPRKYGAIVVATGYRTQLMASSEPDSGGKILSQAELCRMLAAQSLEKQPRTVGFIFDFADENSRFPTLATLDNALAAKEKWDSEVYVFCKSVKVDSKGAEKLYREARARGIVFLKCETPPKVLAKNGRVEIQAQDILMGEDTVFACDVLVAEQQILPAEDADILSSLLNVGRDSKGFYQDENVHLYPVALERKGIFVVGGCRGDLDGGRVLSDISSAVMSIYELLSPGKIVVDSEKVKANPQKCVACLTCFRVCPHSAIQLMRAENEKEVAQVADAACDACGICAAICPAKAISFEGYTDEQIVAQIEALGTS